MGEKPLGIDEAQAPMGTIAGGAPLGGVDVPPPAMKAGSGTSTGSNIKKAGSTVATSKLPKGLEPTPTRPGDPSPVDPRPGGAGDIATYGEPIPGIDVKLGKNPGGAATTGPDTPEPTRPNDPFPAEGGPAGIAVKEQGVRYGEATPAGDPPPFDNDTPAPGDIDPSAGMAEGEPESVTIKGSDGSTLTLTQLATDVNVMELVDEEDVDLDFNKKKP